MSEQVLKLCLGRVMHARARPFAHRFVYRVFCLRLRIDLPAELKAQQSWLLGIERASLVSFYAKDHGARDGTDLMNWLRDHLSAAQVDFELGAVWLQCFPRVLGYVFNPVSFWFVHDKSGCLRALLAEVNNTFGQRHQYLLVAPDRKAITDDSLLECAKVFHVSPFCAVTGVYRFSQRNSATHARMAIDYFEAPEDMQALLCTALVVKLSTFTTGKLFKALLSMPMMTLGVMWRIHWQAFKLWRLGAKYHPIPALPSKELTDNLRSHQ